jgi:hypothetical protein
MLNKASAVVMPAISRKVLPNVNETPQILEPLSTLTAMFSSICKKIQPKIDTAMKRIVTNYITKMTRNQMGISTKTKAKTLYISRKIGSRLVSVDYTSITNPV